MDLLVCSCVAAVTAILWHACTNKDKLSVSRM